MSEAPAPELDCLLRATARLLRPLVRLLIRHGITFPMLAETLRGLYVDVAATELLPDPRARTDSRISLLTGVHRKEIRRLRLEPRAPDAISCAVSIGSQVIAHWTAGRGTTDAAGQPVRLPRSAGADLPSFERLVRSITTDIRPRAVLDDLCEQGIAILHPDDTVSLAESAYIPRPGDPKQLFFFARNLHDHLAAAAANVGAVRCGTTDAPFVDRSVHYDRLSLPASARLQQLGRAAAQRLLLEVNRAALDLVSDEVPGEGPTQRVNLGVYLYIEDEAAPETEQ